MSEATVTSPMEEKFLMLLEALTQRKSEGIDAETLKAILAANATGVQKALKPENTDHPGISTMSYPEGDKAKPREGILKVPFFWNNFPVHKAIETHHYRELELAAQVEPGVYTALRKDGSLMTVTVDASKDAAGNISEIRVTYPVSREEKWLIPPMMVLLYQIVYNDGNPQQRFVEAMTEFFKMSMPGAVAA